MQFKYPELLWALLALLIPILIHLFQLRRFKKTPFTNVKLLQKVVSESRKSSTLKKWLLLCTRLLLLAALIVAFAQPFFMAENALKARETVVYLDDSFSMQAKTDYGTLLEMAVQDLLATVPKDEKLTIFTNTRVFQNVTIFEIQNELLALPFTPNQLGLDDIFLKGATLFRQNSSTLKHIILISDFQKRMQSAQIDTLGFAKKYAVQLRPTATDNIAIDSVYVENTGATNRELKAVLSSNYAVESVPVSLFNGDVLIAKTAAFFDEQNKALLAFTLPADEIIDGKITLSDTGLAYDNQFYFNINAQEKIKVLLIGDGNTTFLERIFTDDVLTLQKFGIKDLNYALIPSQNLIVLNELDALPTPLQNSLLSFQAEGGSLVIIPALDTDVSNYNAFLPNFYTTSIEEKINSDKKITTIAYDHPLFRNVFEKKVTNFEYPSVASYFRIKTRASGILYFENKEPFLAGDMGTYLFTASLSEENSNFKNSPLIVPTLYKMGSSSLKLPDLYHTLGQTTQLDIPVVLEKDEILRMDKDDFEFIPLQQSFANRVRITLQDNPTEAGIYTLRKGEATLQKSSFNFMRKESELTYIPEKELPAELVHQSVASLFKDLEKENRITQLWKWFVILALLFMLTEILIQKIVK
ncbi:BatA domain-containing protein [Arenibacter sp. GZD96]|uniref:BatA domain-containing protein n=1 Tax=Aurantibrevibacter litoralis TaxID=3106030 RepID=UPI002AFF3D3A|nr:BatA domain-containing protein [Arenibacter sp. GZD-96]MEA1787484.1 BatA domain-containing protein [Arenibacter sp. GZD-96]